MLLVAIKKEKEKEIWRELKDCDGSFLKRDAIWQVLCSAKLSIIFYTQF